MIPYFLQVYGWGANAQYQIGNGNANVVYGPMRITGLLGRFCFVNVKTADYIRLESENRSLLPHYFKASLPYDLRMKKKATEKGPN